MLVLKDFNSLSPHDLERFFVVAEVVGIHDTICCTVSLTIWLVDMSTLSDVQGIQQLSCVFFFWFGTGDMLSY